MDFAFQIDRKVVVDAGAAIRLERIEKFGNDFYTTPEVFDEIKDKQARRHLATLPFELKIQSPTKEDMAVVRDFARETGDLGALSENDMGIIALAVALHREAGGEIREHPELAGVTNERAPFAWVPEAVSECSSRRTSCLTANGAEVSQTNFFDGPADLDLLDAIDEDDEREEASDVEEGAPAEVEQTPAAEEVASAAHASSSSSSSKPAWGAAPVKEEVPEFNAEDAFPSLSRENFASEIQEHLETQETGPVELPNGTFISEEAFPALGSPSKEEFPALGGGLFCEGADIKPVAFSYAAAAAAGKDAVQADAPKKTVKKLVKSCFDSAGALTRVEKPDSPVNTFEVESSRIEETVAAQPAEENNNGGDDDDGWAVIPKKEKKITRAARHRMWLAEKEKQDAEFKKEDEEQGAKMVESGRILSAGFNTVVATTWKEGDDEGWVTTENIGRLGSQVVKDDDDEGDNSSGVGLLSTDYSVQNVCIQMGLKAISCDGYRIRSVKLWGKICRGCFASTRDTSKMFCPK